MRRREQAALFHFELPWSEHRDQEVLLLTVGFKHTNSKGSEMSLLQVE